MEAPDIEDLFKPFAKVELRRMFGAFGVYHESLIFACLIRGEVYLRTDAETEPAFAAAGSEKWVYQGKNNTAATAMPYWRMPEAAHDDEAELIRFSRLAMEAARRAAAGKAAKARPAGKTHQRPFKTPAKKRPAVARKPVRK